MLGMILWHCIIYSSGIFEMNTEIYKIHCMGSDRQARYKNSFKKQNADLICLNASYEASGPSENSGY